jgi:hypothetical protein
MRTKAKERQVNQYDKIFRENIEAVISSIMKNMLEITAVSMEELPDDVQHTKERRPDVLKKVTDHRGETFVLHIELQLKDEPEMVYRMAEYYIMLTRKYQLPTKQFLIFLGSTPPTMPNRLTSESLQFNFPIIVFSDLDYHVFLNSHKPEEVILALLANFKNESPDSVVRKILLRIRETTQGDFSLQRYFNQLRILAQLRNLEPYLKTAMDSIEAYIKEEKDVLFLLGQEREQIKFVTNLIQKLNMPYEEIAEVAGVTVDFVKKVHQKIQNTTK